MKTLLPTEARNHWKKLLHDVSEGDEVLIHIRNNREIIMLPKELYESLLGTIEVLSDPQAMRAIRAHKKGVGRRYSLQDIDKLIEA